MVYNFHSNSLIVLGAVLIKTSNFFMNIMRNVKTQRFRELFVKNIFIIYFI